MDWLGKVKSLVTGIPDFLDSLFPEPWKCEQCGRPLHHVGKPICSVCAGRMRAILHQKGKLSLLSGHSLSQPYSCYLSQVKDLAGVVSRVWMMSQSVESVAAPYILPLMSTYAVRPVP